MVIDYISIVKMKIVHISSTPLVGAPGKISLAQRMKGDDSICFVLKDYPQKGPLYEFFTKDSIKVSTNNRDFFYHSINSADIIHIHNFIDQDTLNQILKLNTNALNVLQMHAPLREGPLYYPREYDADFDKKLVIAQHHTRFYPDYIPVPNIVLEPPSFLKRKDNEKLKVLYSPTSRNSYGRWNNKYTEGLEKLLQQMHLNNTIEYHAPSVPIPPIELNIRRKYSDVTIGDIESGGFHMVSLEALALGNITVNKADFFAKQTFRSISGGVPPFHYCDMDNIHDFLYGLAKDVKLTNDLKYQSFDFFTKFCNPINLVKSFDIAYGIRI